MDKDALACHLALERCPGIGPTRFKRLLDDGATDIDQLFGLSREALVAAGFSTAQIDYLKNPDWTAVEQALAWQSEQDHHHILTLSDPAYPDLLKTLTDAPPAIYCLGNLDLLSSPQLAIVGSRHCTPGGGANAAEFSRHLASAGFTITSGLALGIDYHAHQAALDAGGATVAVIATGIDRIYPARHRDLAHRIAEQGVIVSEFALGAEPRAQHFPKRNRIISGLSLGVLVVEATLKSGSLITARHAMEQGREVFAMPGSIHNPQARGCHQLIRDGAKLVDQASDIIDDIGSLLGFIAETANAAKEQTDGFNKPLDPEYQALLESMGYDPVSIDTLLERTGLTVDQLSSMLLILELNDQIKTAPGGFYVRC